MVIDGKSDRPARCLDRADDLTAGRAELCQHLCKVGGTEIIDVLHRVIQQDALPFALCDREIDGQEECETCRPALAAREDELGVHVAIDL